jgi:hypothetical protein
VTGRDSGALEQPLGVGAMHVLHELKAALGLIACCEHVLAI